MAAISDGLAELIAAVRALSGGTSHKVRLDSRPCHRLDGLAAGCDGLGDFRCSRTIGSASRLAPGLSGRAVGWRQRSTSSVAV